MPSVFFFSRFAWFPLAVMGLGLLLVIAVLADWRASNLELEWREQLALQARDLAAALEPLPALLPCLSCTDNAACLRFIRHLRRYAAYAGYHAIWSVLRDTPATRIVLTASAENEACSKRVVSTADWNDALTKAFTSGVLVTAPRFEAAGAVVSALAPLGTQAVVGFDVSALQWRGGVRRRLFVALAVSTAGGVIAALVLIAAERCQRLQHRRYYLEPVLIGVFGLVVTVAAATIAHQLGAERQNRLFERLSDGYAREARSAALRTLTALDPALRASNLKMPELVDDLFSFTLLRLDDHPHPVEVPQRPARWWPVLAEEETWVLILAAAPGFLRLYPNPMAWWAAIIGLALTVAATALIVGLRQRQLSLERTVAEHGQALEVHEARLNAIAHAVRDAIIVMDDAGRIAYWNPGAEHLLGYTAAEASGQDLHALLASPEDNACFRTRLGYFQRTGTGSRVGQLTELTARGKDGSTCAVELSLSALLVAGRWQAVGVLRDITQRKRTEARLLRLNDSLAGLGPDYSLNVARLVAVSGEIFAADIALYNHLSAEVLTVVGRGQAPPELPLPWSSEGPLCHDLIQQARGRPAGDSEEAAHDLLILPDLAATPYCDTDPNVRRYGLRACFGHVVRCGDDPVGMLCVLFRQPRMASEEELRLLGILAAALSAEQNRHQAVQQLARSEQRLALATRGAGIGIWEQHLVTDILVLDERMTTLLGLSHPPTNGTRDDWARYLVAADARSVLAALAAAQAGTCTEFALEPRVWPLGAAQPRVLSLLGSTVHDADGRPERVLGVCFDITPLKHTEAQLRQALDLAEQANRAKAEFFAHMSHELRTPLNAVLGFAQLLDSDEQLTPEQREQVGEILQAGSNLLRLINEILDLTNVDAGRVALQYERLPLYIVLDEAVRAVQAQAARRGLQIGLECPAELVVITDRLRLRQILDNLLANVVRYGRSGGTAQLRGLALSSERTRIRIELFDGGSSIDPQRARILLEPYAPTAAPLASSGSAGYGVGLIIARRLIEIMGGTIGIHADPTGNTFWLELPDGGLESGTPDRSAAAALTGVVPTPPYNGGPA